MRVSYPSSARYTRRDSYSTTTEDVKFFGKVVLPLVGRYFTAHRLYLIGGGASAKEKEMVVLLFCKLGALLRLLILICIK